MNNIVWPDSHLRPSAQVVVGRTSAVKPPSWLRGCSVLVAETPVEVTGRKSSTAAKVRVERERTRKMQGGS